MRFLPGNNSPCGRQKEKCTARRGEACVQSVWERPGKTGYAFDVFLLPLRGKLPYHTKNRDQHEKNHFSAVAPFAALFSALKNYVEKEVVGGPDHLEKSRITEADSAAGTLAASIEEWLYFAKRAWVTHRTIFYYQLVCEVEDGRFTVSLRNLRYHYVENDTPGVENLYRAEDWITDDEALNKQKTKLTRIAGKFRRFTIDRKDALFQGAARAVGLE